MPLGKYKSLADSLKERYGPQKVREMYDKMDAKQFKEKAGKDLNKKGFTDIEQIGTLFYDKETKTYSMELEADAIVTLTKQTDDPNFRAFWLEIEKDTEITLRRKPQ